MAIPQPEAGAKDANPEATERWSTFRARWLYFTAVFARATFRSTVKMIPFRRLIP